MVDGYASVRPGLLTYCSFKKRRPPFRDLAKAAEWLDVPVEVLGLKDKPMP
jgi:hypothetical protein